VGIWQTHAFTHYHCKGDGAYEISNWDEQCIWMESHITILITYR